MRISELARRSGIGVSTIKFYLHAGLLPAGVVTARNQATYDDEHLRRLHVIRALMDVGGLSVLGTRAVLDAAASEVPPPELLAVVDAATAGHRHRYPDDDRHGPPTRSAARVLTAQRWRVRPEAHALDRLNQICTAARLLELDELCTALDGYAEAAARLAAYDAEVVQAIVARIDATGRRADLLLESVAIVAVLGAAIQAALCGLAREDALVRLLGEGATR